jgi:hypothetical protein
MNELSLFHGTVSISFESSFNLMSPTFFLVAGSEEIHKISQSPLHLLHGRVSLHFVFFALHGTQAASALVRCASRLARMRRSASADAFFLYMVALPFISG